MSSRQAHATADRRGRPRAAEADQVVARPLRVGRRGRPRRRAGAMPPPLARRSSRWIWACRPTPDSVSEGFKLLEQLLDIDPDIKVIVLTGQNDQANALRAVALGAYDFFAKPFEPDLLGLTIDRAYRLSSCKRRTAACSALHAARRACRPDHARSGDAAHLPHDREGRVEQRHRAAARRKRHRQGSAGPGPARGLEADRQVRGDQLRGDSGEPARKRALRLREGRLHRRREDDPRQDRDAPTAAR